MGDKTVHSESYQAKLCFHITNSGRLMLNLYLEFSNYRMRRIWPIILFIFFASCGRNTGPGEKIITVSIAPFKYFVDAISGGEYEVNVIVPAGSDPHVYEPFPDQISRLRKSIGYICNGYLGFEMTWLDRFDAVNPTMKKLSLKDNIVPIIPDQGTNRSHLEGADPHYWVSPKCAMIMAKSVRDFLSGLNPAQAEKYNRNNAALTEKIGQLDSLARELFSTTRKKIFMIYHPNLAYIARDYGLEEIPVEYEGKEPPPSRMKELIDKAMADSIKTIFIQKEYDRRNARAIAGEVGAQLVTIDPLSEDWMKSTTGIIDDLYTSLK